MWMGGKSYIHSIIYALPGQLKWNWILSRHIDSGFWDKSQWDMGFGSKSASQLNDTNFYCLSNVRRNINTSGSK